MSFLSAMKWVLLWLVFMFGPGGWEWESSDAQTELCKMHVIPVSHEVGFPLAGFHVWARRLGVGEVRCTATVRSNALFIRLIICTF
jgi:bacteriorhodopsin